MIKISVVIPTFNCAQFLPCAIDSVLNQTYQPFEIIVIDDGSTDNTSEVVKKYATKVKYKYQKNSGVASARNLGIKSATGDWLGLLDSDDEWEQDKLAIQTEDIARNNNLCLHIVNANLDREHSGKVNLFDYIKFPYENLSILHNPLEYQIKYGIAWSQTALIKIDTIRKCGLFDENIKVLYEDLDFFCRLAIEGAWGICTKPLVNICRRDSNENNLSHQRIKNPIGSLTDLLYIYKKLHNDPRISQTELKIIKTRLYSTISALGKEYLKNGDLKSARMHFQSKLKANLSFKSFLQVLISYLPASFIKSVYSKYKSN